MYTAVSVLCVCDNDPRAVNTEERTRCPPRCTRTPCTVYYGRGDFSQICFWQLRPASKLEKGKLARESEQFWETRPCFGSPYAACCTEEVTEIQGRFGTPPGTIRDLECGDRGCNCNKHSQERLSPRSCAHSIICHCDLNDSVSSRDHKRK